jgi:hypothetical protein
VSLNDFTMMTIVHIFIYEVIISFYGGMWLSVFIATPTPLWTQASLIDILMGAKFQAKIRKFNFTEKYGSDNEEFRRSLILT